MLGAVITAIGALWRLVSEFLYFFCTIHTQEGATSHNPLNWTATKIYCECENLLLKMECDEFLGVECDEKYYRCCEWYAPEVWLPMGSGRLWSGSRSSLCCVVYRFYCDFCLWWFVFTFLVTIVFSVFAGSNPWSLGRLVSPPAREPARKHW